VIPETPLVKAPLTLAVWLLAAVLALAVPVVAARSEELVDRVLGLTVDVTTRGLLEAPGAVVAGGVPPVILVTVVTGADEVALVDPPAWLFPLR
jgi:hypothetical protein